MLSLMKNMQLEIAGISHSPAHLHVQDLWRICILPIVKYTFGISTLYDSNKQNANKKSYGA
jgi:hypothetical protein